MRSLITSTAVAIALACGFGPCDSPMARGEDRLEWLYQKHSFDYWREKLQAKHPKVREQAVVAVGSFVDDPPQQIQSLLIGMVEDAAPPVRRAAIWQLSLIASQPGVGRQEVVIDALTQRLTDSEEDREIRRAAASALGNLEVAGAEALAAAISHIDDEKVRAAAIEELSRIPHDLHNDIEEMPAVREAIRQLAQQPGQTLKQGDLAPLLRQAIDRVEEPQERAYASKLLAAADRIADIAAQRLVAEINADEASAMVRANAMRLLLSFSNRKAPLGAIDELSDALSSDDDHLKFWAATALAALDPASEAGDKAVTMLVADLVRRVQTKGDSEELYWRFLFATVHADRREEIFQRIVAQLDDEELVAKVQAIRFGILEDMDALTPDLLVTFLKYQEPYLRKRVADELARLGPPVAKPAAPALAKVLQELPENDLQASQVASPVIQALATIDPDAEHTPSLDAKTLVRLAYLSGSSPWVIERLRDSREAVEELVNYIERMPGTPQPTKFERNLAGNSPSERFTTVLAYVGEPAVPGLMRLLIHGHDDYRGWDAAMALGQIEPAGVEALIELAEHEKAAVRVRAVTALHFTVPVEGAPDQNVLDALIAAAKDESADVRSGALAGLGRLDGARVTDDQFARLFPVLAENLHSKNDAIALRAISALRSLGEAKPEPVIAEFRKALQNGNPNHRLPIFHALHSFGEKSAAALPEVRQIIERNEKHRSAALETITKMGPAAAREAEPLLREALDSPDQWDQLWAAVALAQLEDRIEEAVPALINVMKTGVRANMHAGRDPRVLAAEALGRLGPAAEAAVEPLIEVASLRPDAKSPDIDDVYKLIQAAVAALGQIGRQPEKVLPVLTDLLEFEFKEVGWPAEEAAHQAVLALRSFADQAELPAEGLIRRFKSPNKQPVTREMLLSMGEKAVPALADALDEKELALPAADLLGEMGTSAAPAVPELVNLVRDRGLAADVRAAAIEALGRIGKPAQPAIPYLEALSQLKASANSMEQRRAEAARQALQRVRDSR